MCFRQSDLVAERRPPTLRFAEMIALVLSLILAIFPSIAAAQSREEQPPAQAEEQEPGQAEEAGMDPLPPLLTAINIPARGVLCGLTGVVAGVFMAASAGMRYSDAGKMVEESCSGPWIITREMLDESRAKEEKDAEAKRSEIPGGEMPIYREPAPPPDTSP